MKKITLLIACFVAMYINAQNEPTTKNNETSEFQEMVTDRPDATEAPTTVPKGALQVETGFMYEEVTTAGITEQNTTYNTTLFRYGVSDNFEFRLGFDIVKSELDIPSSPSANGINPMYAGFKIAIAEEKNGWPEIGFLGGVFLPFTASKDLKSPNTGADFRFSLAHTISNTFSVGYNIGVGWDGVNPDAVYLYTLSLGIAITDKLGTYLEIYGDMPENTEAGHSFDGGITYLVSRNVQLDILGGTGLNTNQDFFVAGGVSFRIPK